MTGEKGSRTNKDTQWVVPEPHKYVNYCGKPPLRLPVKFSLLEEIDKEMFNESH